MFQLMLHENEGSALRNALVLAKEKYLKNAAELRAMKPELEAAEAADSKAMRLIHSSAVEPLAEQFEQQAAGVGELLEKVDAAMYPDEEENS